MSAPSALSAAAMRLRCGPGPSRRRSRSALRVSRISGTPALTLILVDLRWHHPQLWNRCPRAGALFALTAVPDPSWLAVIVLGGRAGDVGVVVLAHALWMLLSQLPLWLIFGAVLAGRHERAIAAFQRVWQRVRPEGFTATKTCEVVAILSATLGV